MYISRNRYKADPVLLGWVCFIFLVITSCGREEEESIKFKVPSNFPPPTYTFDNNPVTTAGFRLGKTLFFDPNLSRDGSVSCNNCHLQSTAFADSQVHPVSVGVDNRVGTRNAPSLANMAFYPEYFWDGGVTHLDFVPINAIESDVEMDETVENVIKKLNASAEYKIQFREAFGIEEITLPYTLYALSQFTSMMVSANSRYDQYVRNEGVDLSAKELSGLKLFNQKCSTCHSGPLFTDFSYRNNGLDSAYTDTGRNRITSLPSDIGKFRVPSLRNVALTSPYMHNARFKTLDEVLDHYSNGMKRSHSIDSIFIASKNIGISMTTEEKDDIIAFLHTLTDEDFIRNPIFFKN